MKKTFLLVAVALLILLCTLSSCASYKVASYSVVLDAVESPADTKEQFGETIVFNFDDDGVSKYSYEDDYINIVWYVLPQKFCFTLTNKSDHALKINWDDISYVDIYGRAGRVMHSGISYSNRNNPQPALTIPKGAKISDTLLPTNNVFYNPFSGLSVSYLIPSVYRTKSELQLGAPQYVGKTMTILMPIMIENVQNDYTFFFTVDDLL